ncbi:hypothetical protein [Herbaspirillum autotrophicum]|uniref:hypothetical protein n=1 Tax=Herbaspirillum autotrophicum TaxID=180195 RepID=UPI0012ED0C82|nr:hypothetical protein [Herbaspirillum autotrophicum]
MLFDPVFVIDGILNQILEGVLAELSVKEEPNFLSDNGATIEWSENVALAENPFEYTSPAPDAFQTGGSE